MMEKPSVALHRYRFLRSAKDLDWEKVIFLDGTWLNKIISKSTGWSGGTIKSSMGVPLGKGSRIITCHAGGSKGWVKAEPLIFSSKKTNDYHEEMNSVVFEKWFIETLLPSLESNSIIIMDNASYHSRVIDRPPTMKTKRPIS